MKVSTPSTREPERVFAREGRCWSPAITTLSQRVVLGLAFLSAMCCESSLAAIDETTAADSSARESPPRWSEEILALFASLPVQDGGRIKPLDTVARFKLLRFNGRSSCNDLDGEKLSALECLLDSMFHPEVARKYSIFIVQSSEVMDAIGVTHKAKKKRDRYSYDEILPGREKLLDLARRYEQIEAKDRSAIEGHIVLLAYNVYEFEQQLGFLDFARRRFPLPADSPAAGIFPGKSQVRFSEVLVHGADIQQRMSELTAEHGAAADPQSLSPQVLAMYRLFDELPQSALATSHLALFPPPAVTRDMKEWFSVADLTQLIGAPILQPTFQVVGLLEALVDQLSDPAAFTRTLRDLHRANVTVAEQRDEYSKVPLEVTFYKGQFFFYGLFLYLLSFVLVAVSWLKSSKWLNGAILSTLSLATLMLITGIVMRCIIRGRPPVSTLYETILFITSIAVIACFIVEAINRRRIALSLAAVLGAGGLFLANGFEAKEGGDTMPSLVAVLDTNFWLSTHVTTVTAGYAAGLLAAAKAKTYLLLKLLGFKKNDPDFYRALGRMVYGTVCFGVLLSTVGTILGGIWANYSWGRFWGWDPKENGALLIVLWELALIHARMGGYVRDFGFCMGAVFGGMVVAFSWWGVNLLGEGLHSYGFTSGVQTTLNRYYLSAAIVLVISGLSHLCNGRRNKEGIADPP